MSSRWRSSTPHYLQSCRMAHSIKQRFRVTNFTLSLSPRENAGSNGANAGDSTNNTTNADCQFLHELDGVGNRLGSYHDEGERFEIFVAHTNTEGCRATRSGLLHVLLDVPSLIRCLYQRLQLGVSISTNLYVLSTIKPQVRLTSSRNRWDHKRTLEAPQQRRATPCSAQKNRLPIPRNC